MAKKQSGQGTSRAYNVLRLTGNEKRDVVKLVEANKPLPEKYRWLLFDDKREVELVWNGKTAEVCNVVLPFQTIEQVDEPRTEASSRAPVPIGIFDVDGRGRQLKGWTNKLIWGDNKLILSSLKNGYMRKEIEDQGGLKLIYIDPPFDVGADFSMDIEIGGDTFTKKPNVLEELAYRDTWGKGADSFIAMFYERLVLMRDLLADDGSIYVHCDWRLTALVRMVLDEIFGKESFINEIIWSYKSGGATDTRYGRKHDTIHFFSKGDLFIFNVPKEKSYNRGLKPYRFKGIEEFKDEMGWYTMVNARDVWSIDMVGRTSSERVDYPTQKPEALLERVIQASSNEGDLIADFFCGSGTTCAVAEKLGRKWIGSDLGKFAIHATRKRMIGVQRQLKKENQNYRAFEVLNLGKYERQHYIGVNPRLGEAEREGQVEQKSREYQELILTAYSATPIQQSEVFHGKKAGRMVTIGPINLPVARLFVEEIILECRRHQVTRVDVLGFEFEMGLFPQIQQEAKAKGIDLALKYIPVEVFDKRAVARDEVVFHDVAYIEVGIEKGPDGVAVSLTDFSVHYSQDLLKDATAALKNGRSKVIAEAGKIVKISKDKKGNVSRETLTEEWSDWVDYWSVDFDFESKREIIRVPDEETGEMVEKWTGDYVFENEWQSFRTRKNRVLELKTPFHSKYGSKIAVKVVDIFGNDTMKIVEGK